MNYGAKNNRNLNSNYLTLIYLRYSWGAEENSELLNEANRFITQANAVGLNREVEHAISQGREAYRLTKYLDSLLKTDGIEAADAWLDKQEFSLDRRILTSLDIYLDKWEKRQEQLKTRQEKKIYHSKLTPVVFDGFHPNSLRHLKADLKWTIFIDERGQNFDKLPDADVSMPSHQLGRIVALAVPGRTQLKPIKGGFHATEASSEEVDEYLEYLLAQDVGVFGFTVNDPVALAGNWFSHVVLLARWVLLQLPLLDTEISQVNFVIERNDARLAYQSIDSLANLLEGELRAIDTKRFENIQITATLMDKNHPLNAYVDVLAFTWGSPSAVSKDRLKKSGLLGHCFLRPDQQSLERLYLSIAKNKKLLAADWYKLCTAVVENSNSLLSHYLKQLGLQAQHDLFTWQYYLDEVRSRMRYKDFKLSEVANALDWLESYTPLGEELPAIYRLPLETSRLGQENHTGHVNSGRLQTCIGLIQRLEEEDAQQACGALLRVLVSASNVFQFDTLKFLLDEWLAKPISVSGLANYARLYSSRGQLHAFCHCPQEAIKDFDQALVLFDRLSDKQRAKLEKQQTNSYRLVCLMDAELISAKDLFNELAANKDTVAYSRRIAASDYVLRYSQYLWLRALISFPDVSVEERKAYLMHPHQWQSGEDHPWGLILAYRAWLLLIEGQSDQASELLIKAIDLCENEKNGPVLWWMAEVLRTLAHALGLTQIEETTNEKLTLLKKVLPDAPHAELLAFAEAGLIKSHKVVLHHLRQCLPFNFH
ncbi:hypothetical protein [Oligella urethralis]|uniref:Uncharacterized protein n=1 Tax=Oligella urethralis TaxID=90245 RepID=A0A2X1UNC2_9BURK|nr:hypothetical protein [Oligella urethralis]SPY08607.1 Uncharacterised protein [Oligella urethralis]